MRRAFGWLLVGSVSVAALLSACGGASDTSASATGDGAAGGSQHATASHQAGGDASSRGAHAGGGDTHGHAGGGGTHGHAGGGHAGSGQGAGSGAMGGSGGSSGGTSSDGGGGAGGGGAGGSGGSGATSATGGAASGGGGASASGGNGAGGDGGGVVSTTIDPSSATVQVSLGGSASQAYVVDQTTASGTTDITSTCTFSIDPEFGTTTGATATVGPHGGSTTVTARCGPTTVTATLDVDLVGTVIGGANVPPNPDQIFEMATPSTDPAHVPVLEYPIDASIAPVNIPPIEVQWAAAGNNLFHITLAAPHLSVHIYTDDVQSTLTTTDWDAIAGTSAGDTLVISLEGLVQSDPSTKYTATPVHLGLSHDRIDKTALYYWASSIGNLMTQTFGATTAPTSVKSDCTSCHSVSRTGTRIGYSRCVAGDCNQLFAGFMKYDKPNLAWTDTVNANDKAVHGSYTTFSPLGNPYANDDEAVAIVSMANGSLELYDPDTGAIAPSNLAAVSTHGPSGARAGLMADWSPGGSSVVFTSTPHPGQWIDLTDGAIAALSYTGDGRTTNTFGEPQFLFSPPITLPTGTYTNLFFPSYSPDGELIVFNAARDAWRNFNDARTAGQRLMLGAADGSWSTDLGAANGPQDYDITWPHWAPTQNGDFYWVVFSSERDYGHEITAANTAAPCKANGVRQCKQIWIAAIDKAKVAAGGTIDPSSPPLWLPGQDKGADNISPYWTVPAITRGPAR